MNKVAESLTVDLEPPRFVDHSALLFAGINERYNSDQPNANMVEQWKRFLPHVGRVPGEIGRTTYGVLHDGDDDGNIEYLSAVAVTDVASVPAKLTTLRVPAHSYAVFSHRDHVSKIRVTWNAIWNKWLPDSGFEADEAPAFERYSEPFDPATGLGGAEIWIPIKTK